jgi:organic hydroperoxide reductase OsmC/OhrA
MTTTAPNVHHYHAELVWTAGAAGATSDYESYSRGFEVHVAGKPPLAGSADPAFRGDPAVHNPEDLLLMAVSSCHMLSYLALCARRRIEVVEYRDHAEGTMTLRPDGGGAFTEITLHPRVTLAAGSDAARALALHERSHAICFIASSCNFPIHHQAEVVVLQGAPAGASATGATPVAPESAR